MKTYFISGHRDLTQENFDKYYVPKLREAVEEGSTFVVGDYHGADTMAQTWLSDELTDHTRVTVYHMFDSPMNLVSKDFNTVGGFKDDISRDSAMTLISDEDIAFIGKGRWTSGTAQNILRRYEVDF